MLPKKKAPGNARTDSLAPEHVETLDYEQLVQTFSEKQDYIEQLEKQLDDVTKQVDACIAVLLCSSPEQLSEALDQQQEKLQEEDFAAHFTPVPLETCRAIERCQKAEQQVDLYKLLGTEIMQEPDEKLLCRVHTQDVQPNSLPLQIFSITKAPDTAFYRMRPREITYHLDLDVTLRNLMMKSSYDDIILCFRSVQNLIIDLVNRDNVYQALTKEKLIQNSLACSKDRMQISFMLPTKEAHVPHRETESNEDAGKNIKFLMSSISLSLHFEASAERCWGAHVCCPNDPELKSVPHHVDHALRTFLSNLAKEDVVTCVRELLRELSRQSSHLDFSDTEASSSGDEFAGIF